jgi:undecaprenyl-diphosphatase
MDLLTGVILGLIQGITEWLPVSSTGHLVIAQEIARIPPEEMVFFNLVLHAATLVSVTFYLRGDLKKIIPSMFRRGDAIGPDARHYRRLGWFSLLATIPVAIAGLIESLYLKEVFSNIAVTAIGLLITGTMLWIAEARKLRKERTEIEIKDALAIGCLQAVSVVPGISRSGSTISAGCYLGFKRDFVATFSFMLSIPAIILAFSYGAIKLNTLSADMTTTLVSAAVAGVTGVLALSWLFKQIQRFRLRWFAVYCWLAVLGIIAMIALNIIHY